MSRWKRTVTLKRSLNPLGLFVRGVTRKVRCSGGRPGIVRETTTSPGLSPVTTPAKNCDFGFGVETGCRALRSRTCALMQGSPRQRSAAASRAALYHIFESNERSHLKLSVQILISGSHNGPS